MNKTFAIKIEDLYLSIEHSIILERINLEIAKNDFLGVIGPNGGGKTTLLKVLLGLIKPTAGRISIFGKTPENSRSFIGYLPQKCLIDTDFPISVWDVVLMGCLKQKQLMRPYSNEQRKLAEEALERVKMLTHKNHPIGELSGGQQQRVFLARAIMSKPKLLLLDEPTSSIDASLHGSIYEFLKELKKNMAIILVTHDVGAISSYVDKVACLNRKLYYHGTKELTTHDLEEAYQCPIDLISHGHPHRIMKEHK